MPIDKIPNQTIFNDTITVKDVNIDGQSSRSISENRNTTSNTAGNNLTIQGGGATISATDKDGGMCIISPGLSTGTGKASVRIKRNSRAATTGTSDNILSDAIVIPSSKSCADNTSTNLFSIVLPTLTSIGGMFSYVIKCSDASDTQCESGIVLFSNSNKGGVFTSSIVKAASTQTVSTGTYIVSFTISSANPSIISVTADSSLNVASIISYNLLNKGEQDITQI